MRRQLPSPFTTIIIAAAFWTAPAYVPAQELDAVDTVKATTREVLERLEADRALLERDPEHIRIVVEELIVPHMDFRGMAELVLGGHWTELTIPEQACFTIALRDMLVERYAEILLAYDNQQITYDPAASFGDEGYVKVRQTISRDDPRPLPLEYPMRPDGEGWKVIDLVVDGISLVRSFRGTFGEDIRRMGLREFVRDFPVCGAPPEDSGAAAPDAGQ